MTHPIVSAIGTSHSPVLPTTPALWADRAGQDRYNPELYGPDGRIWSFDSLLQAAGDEHVVAATPQAWQVCHLAAQTALDRLATAAAELQPDVVVIVGDDQGEAFDRDNQPAIAVCWAKSWHTGRDAHAPPGPFFAAAASGYAMDAEHDFDGAHEFGRDLVTGLVGRGFDVASVAGTPSGHAFGHAFGFVIRRLLGDTPPPVVPVLLNTYFPPNQPTAARCVDLGVALRAVCEDLGEGRRVLLVASGGLSHFVVNEALDRLVLDAIGRGDADALRRLPEHLLNSGSSEIRNWLVVAGAMSDRPLAWHAYHPLYRTPAGTGVGLAFAQWT